MEGLDPDNKYISPGEFTVNKDLFENNWKQIRSQTTAWWSLMNDHDLLKVDKAEVKFDKFVTLLRVKYGYTTDQAKKEIVKHVSDYEKKHYKTGIT